MYTWQRRHRYFQSDKSVRYLLLILARSRGRFSLHCSQTSGTGKYLLILLCNPLMPTASPFHWIFLSPLTPWIDVSAALFFAIISGLFDISMIFAIVSGLCFLPIHICPFANLGLLPHLSRARITVPQPHSQSLLSLGYLRFVTLNQGRCRKQCLKRVAYCLPWWYDWGHLLWIYLFWGNAKAAGDRRRDIGTAQGKSRIRAGVHAEVD